MRKRMGMVCLAAVLALVIVVVASPSYGANINVQIKLDRTATPTEIYVNTLGNRFVGVCKAPISANSKKCQGNGFEWRLVVQGSPGQLEEGEEVRIRNAPNHPDCFGLDPVHTFNSVNQNIHHESGEPAIACTQHKYGTYWPYVIEYYKDGTRKATSDPGGIIFP